MTTQYAGNWNTDGCTSAACSNTLAATSSLSQGNTFADLTKTLHGGKRYSRKNQRGGMADYPGEFSETLPSDMHAAAYVQGQDAAFAALPQFVGKYGMSGGKRRKNSRRHRKHGGGFGYTPGPANAPNYMILSPQEEGGAMLNPQWYTENLVVPSYQAPISGYAAQASAQYANQVDYKQHAGKRSRKNKNRKASRKASRKNRMASRKASRQASRKNRKASRKY